MSVAMTYGQDNNAGKDTGEFNGHWFIGVYGGIGQTVGETSFGNLISPAAGFNFGYRFTPVWSLRAGIGGWQGKGALLAPTREYKFNYLRTCLPEPGLTARSTTMRPRPLSHPSLQTTFCGTAARSSLWAGSA